MIDRFAPLAATVSAALLSPAPAAAELARVTDRDTFVSLVHGREISRFGVSLVVTPDGGIAGHALGRDVTGTWSWQNGYFCREMEAGGTEVEYNCQAVSVQADNIRFQSDQGTGEYLDFRLR